MEINEYNKKCESFNMRCIDVAVIKNNCELTEDRLGSYISVYTIISKIHQTNRKFTFGLLPNIRRWILAMNVAVKKTEEGNQSSLYQPIKVFIAGGAIYDDMIQLANKCVINNGRK